MNRTGMVLALALAARLASGGLPAAAGESYTPGQPVHKDFDRWARSFLASHCVDCHGATEP
jgi:mono/diheme cytochrome c family protein